MNWAFIKQFPKYAIAAGLLLVSTVLFGIWWMMRPQPAGEHTQVAATPPTVAAERIEQCFLADEDLYDVVTGELVAAKWLKGDQPKALFYDKANERILGVLPQGLALYDLSGARVATLFPTKGTKLTDDLKTAFYVKEKDVWTASIDRKELKLTDERRVTSMGIFEEKFFAENVVLSTDKTLLVRNMNQQLRIDLEKGDVKPVQIPLNGIQKRLSPDAKTLVGLQGNQFYAYDVDTEGMKTFPVGRSAATDFQWLDNHRCVVLLAAKQIGLFDRTTSQLEKLLDLTLPCFRLAAPSPTGRYVFCGGNAGGVLLDIDSKTESPLPRSAQGFVWLNDENYLYSSDVPDSSLRGTWVKTPEKEAQRITPEPCLVDKDTGPVLITVSKADQAVFLTPSDICIMKQGGIELVNSIRFVRSKSRLLAFDPELIGEIQR